MLLIVGVIRPGEVAKGASAAVVLVGDLTQRIEARGLGLRLGGAEVSAAAAGGIAEPVERNGVAVEAPVEEDAR